MEKISRIVRGNSRVASVDLKQSAPLRPGTPGFGRAVGESSTAATKGMTTAQKAVAIHQEMLDAKKQAADERIVGQMADQFFMSRVRAPEPGVQAPDIGDVDGDETIKPENPVKSPVAIETPGKDAAPIEASASNSDEPATSTRKPYAPKGTLVDVHV